MSRTGEKAASGKRGRFESRLRGRVHWELEHRKRASRDGRTCDYLHFIPAVRSDEELSALSARVNWYLPTRTVPIFVERASNYEILPSSVPYMDPQLVNDPGWERHQPPGKAHTVLHHAQPGAILRYLRSDVAAVVDSNLAYGSERDFFTLSQVYSSAPVPTPEESVTRLLERRHDAAGAFVLATGPSAKLVDPEKVMEEVRITCNSAVKDLQLLRELRPDVIAFGDRVFHFGPSRYAGQFRQDLLRAAEATDALFVTIDKWVHPLLARYPELSERFVVLPADEARLWRWPQPGAPEVRATGNVLTLLMLPCAFTLADRVVVAGCDGRKPEENYFWRHNRKTQYSEELMQSAFAAHPAFFRDVSYEGYYGRHIEELEELLAAAEAAGKSVTGATPSHIPALLRRGAPPAD